ncbi:hypothetical protein KPL78_19480 [Roseomonas sp. HJA6]|uniref:Anti sigma-E protein RseA N-terminal domain-containing protein n=1 Tax=Roseomonas alba TaxID=2846776 RepID=A0ABS7ACN1_9PROT|nr:hypothetical protein [Neoroseomonas alba]MBW6400051.1 hypothetical protein [Neoroseomonas alba]
MNAMTPDEFTRLLDIHGADQARWPEAQREAAQLLCEASPAARAQWAAARRLDRQIAAARAPRPDPARQARIVSGALARIRARGEPLLDWSWLFTRPIGAAFAASLVAGWLVGSGLGDAPATRHAAVLLQLEDLIQ